jgi:hypothetical protein
MKWNLYKDENDIPVNDYVICRNRKCAIMLRYKDEKMELRIMKRESVKNDKNRFMLLRRYTVPLHAMFELLYSDIIWSFNDFGDKWLFGGLHSSDTPREVCKYVWDCYKRFFSKGILKENNRSWVFGIETTKEQDVWDKCSITDNEIQIIDDLTREAIGLFILKYMYRIMKEVEEKQESVRIISPSVEMG